MFNKGAMVAYEHYLHKHKVHTTEQLPRKKQQDLITMSGAIERYNQPCFSDSETHLLIRPRD